MREASWEAANSSDADRDDLRNPLLGHYSLSERRAILCFRLYLEFRLDGGVSLEVATLKWEAGPCSAWRREKMHRDIQEQLRRIEKHRVQLVGEGDEEWSMESAARDWIEKHAHSWRDWWEQQPESSPVVFPHTRGQPS